jgi:hypothetical protein
MEGEIRSTLSDRGLTGLGSFGTVYPIRAWGRSFRKELGPCLTGFPGGQPLKRSAGLYTINKVRLRRLFFHR